MTQEVEEVGGSSQRCIHVEEGRGKSKSKLVYNVAYEYISGSTLV